jgi:hypothetical protein
MFQKQDPVITSTAAPSTSFGYNASSPRPNNQLESPNKGKGGLNTSLLIPGVQNVGANSISPSKGDNKDNGAGAAGMGSG